MNEKSCAPTCRAGNWDSIDWNKARVYVKKLQMRIVKAQQEGHYSKVKTLQWLLTHSFYAKALAVKRVTSNRGKNTAGVDHELWLTPEAKFKAISKLKRRGYRPQPLKRVYKQKFISQIMTSKSPMRSCDDIDEQALSYAEIKALCAGDPRIREKMDLDVQVAKLKVLRGDFQNQKYRLEDKLLKTFPEEIQKQKTRIAALQQDSQIAAAYPQDKENFCGMTIKGMVYDDKKAAGERLLLARQEMPNADMMLLGTYRGFELNIRFDSFKNEHQAVLRAELSYPVSLGDDARGNITRLDNAIDNFADRIADAENALQNLEQQKQAAEVEVAKPFAQEEELAEKSARLAELNALLNIDRDRSSSQDAPEETEETETPATRPSVLAALEEKANQPEPVKPFRSYYDKDGDAR